jgi:hypothetical protein
VIVRELITKLGFKVDTQKIEAFTSKVGKLKSQLGGLSLLVGGSLGAAAAAVFGLAKATSKAGDDIVDNAQRLGLTTTAYQELSHAAALSGSSIEGVGLGVRSFTRLLEQAKTKGGDAAATLARLGLNASKLGNADQALEAVADRFASMPDGIQKTALAQQLFGRGGLAMIPMLNAGAKGIRAMREEAHALGIVMGEQTLQDAAAFDDMVVRTTTMLTGLRNTIGAALMPVLTEMGVEFQGWYVANRKLIQTKVDLWARRLGRGVKDLAKWIRETAATLKPWIDRMGGAEGAAKKIVVVFLAFKAIQITATVISIGQAFVTLAGGIQKASGAMGLLKAAMASPVLAAVVFLALALAIEDIYVYAKGGKSAVGDFIKEFEKAEGPVGTAARALRDYVGAVKDLWSMQGDGATRLIPDNAESEIDQFFLRLVNKFNELKEWIPYVFLGLIAPLGLVWAVIGEAIWTAIEPALSKAKIVVQAFFEGLAVDVVRMFDAALAYLLGKLEAIPNRVRGIIGSIPGGQSVINAVDSAVNTIAPALLPSPSVRGAGAGGASVQQSVTVGDVSVAVGGTNASPREIQQAVKAGIADGLQQSYMAARLNYAAGER